ncbi:MAG TPA: hypothetical protein VG733_00745 [Chthoniobacteraceae bacterium]|nr:hypothetical protein [Chthoniobacteraceae bacterium]
MKRILLAPAVAGFLFACGNALAITGGHSMLEKPDDAAANPAVQNPDHGKGDPIPIDAAAPTSQKARQDNDAWFTHLTVDAYKKTANPNPKVAALMQKIVDFFCFPTAGPVRGDLEKEANELEAAGEPGTDDPIFQFLSGLVQIDPAHQRTLYTKSLAALKQANAPKYLQFMVSSNLGKKLAEDKAPAAEQDARDKESLDLLRDALAEGAFKEEEMPVLVWQFTQYGPLNLFKRCTADVCSVLEAEPKVKPWVSEYFEGWRAVDEAWKSRGTGWANEVTAEGWRGFNAGIARAREHLIKSWTLNPKSPEAAAEMIVVATAENEENDTMRKWFDRAVAAQMDNPTAYNQMLWGLEPKWLGTKAETLRFGEECLKTGRYDTIVPFTYISAVTDIAATEDDGGQLLFDPEVYKNIQDILAAYLAQKDSPIRARYLHTAAAFMFYRAGKMDEAKQHMEAINYQPAKALEFAQFGDIGDMVTKLRDYKPAAAGGGSGQ